MVESAKRAHEMVIENADVKGFVDAAKRTNGLSEKESKDLDNHLRAKLKQLTQAELNKLRDSVDMTGSSLALSESVANLSQSTDRILRAATTKWLEKRNGAAVGVAKSKEEAPTAEEPKTGLAKSILTGAGVEESIQEKAEVEGAFTKESEEEYKNRYKNSRLEAAKFNELLKIYSIEADGLSTKEQVKKIQEKLGVRVDGLYGPNTEAAANKALEESKAKSKDTEETKEKPNNDSVGAKIAAESKKTMAESLEEDAGKEDADTAAKDTEAKVEEAAEEAKKAWQEKIAELAKQKTVDVRGKKYMMNAGENGTFTLRHGVSGRVLTLQVKEDGTVDLVQDNRSKVGGTELFNDRYSKKVDNLEKLDLGNIAGEYLNKYGEARSSKIIDELEDKYRYRPHWYSDSERFDMEKNEKGYYVNVNKGPAYGSSNYWIDLETDGDDIVIKTKDRNDDKNPVVSRVNSYLFGTDPEKYLGEAIEKRLED